MTNSSHPIVMKLRGGDRRSIGRSGEVVAQVLNDPDLFAHLFWAMLDDDPIVRMRAADAVEKVTARRPDLIQPYKDQLIQRVAKVPQQEVRWHVAQIIPSLVQTRQEQSTVFELLVNFLNDESKIVKTFSMQALADLAHGNEELTPPVVSILENLAKNGSPAMKSRGRKLLARLTK